jgi:hypothetical protein
MRYHELSEATAPTTPSERPKLQPRPFDADIKLVIRFVPAVYRWIDLSLSTGKAHTDIGIDKARVSHPKPYDGNGALTQECRKLIIEAVHDAVERLGMSICIVLAQDDAIYCWPDGVMVVSQRPPKGGLSL